MDSRIPEFVFVDEETTKEVASYTTTHPPYVLAGPGRYFFPESYQTYREQFYNLLVRPDDTFLVAYPRTGTTWIQEMIWLINNNLNYEKAKLVDIDNRFPLLDMCLYATPESEKQRLDELQDESVKEFLKKTIEPAVNKLAKVNSPRFVKTHLAFSLLPPNLLDTAKVVYLIRDPRDVAVSMYNVGRLRLLKDGTSFENFWGLFRRAPWSPIFYHLKEAWEKRDHPNMLFLMYEDISKDLSGTVHRICKFFNKSYSEDQIQGLCEHLSFENFKNNPAVNQSQVLKQLGVVNENNPFIRKGKVGGWREYFQGDLEAEAEQWMTESLADTDFKFPTFKPKQK